MASVTKNDIPQEANMMTELWALIKDYYIPEESTSDYWKELGDKCNEIYRNCPTQLTYHLVHGFLDYIQEKVTR